MASFDYGDGEHCRLMQCGLFHDNQCQHDGRYCVHNTPPETVMVKALWRDVSESDAAPLIDGDIVEEVQTMAQYVRRAELTVGVVEAVMMAMVECGFAAIEEEVH